VLYLIADLQTKNIPNTAAQPTLKMSTTDLQIKFHGEYPHALASSERAKVDDFYAARGNIMPPLPWLSITPPITLQRVPTAPKSAITLQKNQATDENTAPKE
jgi:hypothetical protein